MFGGNYGPLLKMWKFSKDHRTGVSHVKTLEVQKLTPCCVQL